MTAANPCKQRILIAEDSNVIALVMSHALETAGYEVIVTHDGEECLARAFDSSPSLIVLDIMMPKMHGIDVLRAVRADPRTHAIPVMMCSAKDYKTERDEAAKLGATDYLIKPRDPAVLVQKVGEILRQVQKVATPSAAAPAASEAYQPKLNSNLPRFTLWGTRGSTPTLGGRFQRHGGNTSCMSIVNGDDLIIFDAGSGIRDLGLEIMRGSHRKIHLFITHTHWDHIQGYPFFAPAYVPGFDITIYGSSGFGKDLESIFRGQLDRDYFPVQLEDMLSTMSFRHITKDPVFIGDAKITWDFAHHPLATVGYKIEIGCRTLVWMPDNEFLQGYLGAPHPLTFDHPEVIAFSQVIDFLTGTDTLIHEAQYTPDEYPKKVGWGHSSVANACVLMKLAKIKHWVVTHHDPLHDDAFLEAKLQLTRQILDEIGHTMQVENGHDGMTQFL